jgi:glycosidase
MTTFYRKLISLKKANKALWNGETGGTMDTIKTNQINRVFAFYREKDDNRVIVFLNLRNKTVSVKPEINGITGEYTDYFSGGKVRITSDESVALEPWGFKVLIR